MITSSATADARVRIPLSLGKPLNLPARDEIAAVLHHGDFVELVLAGGIPVYLRLHEARRLVRLVGPNLPGRRIQFDGVALEVCKEAGR
jgi:hypothetical protein